jgi:predicted amidophosphoribosyltransferase
VRLGDYRGVLRDALHDLKFTAWRRVGQDLGGLLGVAVADALSNSGVSRADAVVIPIPTTLRRRMVRGIDHSLVLARAAAGVVGCPVVRALDRRHIRPQTALPAGERSDHVRGTMWRRPGISLSGRVVLLVDDIMTTGATMATACRGLQRRPGGRGISGDKPDQVWACVAGVTPAPGARPVVDPGGTTAIGTVSGVSTP